MVLFLCPDYPNELQFSYIDHNGQRTYFIRWLKINIFEKVRKDLGLPEDVNFIEFEKEDMIKPPNPELPVGDTGLEPDHPTFQRVPNLDWTIIASSGVLGDFVDHSPAPMDLTDSRDSQTVSEKLCEILLSKDYCGFEKITSSQDPNRIAEDIHRHT